MTVPFGDRKSTDLDHLHLAEVPSGFLSLHGRVPLWLRLGPTRPRGRGRLLGRSPVNNVKILVLLFL